MKQAPLIWSTDCRHRLTSATVLECTHSKTTASRSQALKSLFMPSDTLMGRSTGGFSEKSASVRELEYRSRGTLSAAHYEKKLIIINTIYLFPHEIPMNEKELLGLLISVLPEQLHRPSKYCYSNEPTCRGLVRSLASLRLAIIARAHIHRRKAQQNIL